jgi:hypothetical protein
MLLHKIMNWHGVGGLQNHVRSAARVGACGSGRQLRPKFSFPTQLIILLHHLAVEVYSREHPSFLTRLLENSLTTLTGNLRHLNHWTLIARGHFDPLPRTSDVLLSLLTIRPSAGHLTPDLDHIQTRRSRLLRRDSLTHQGYPLLLRQHHQVGGDSIPFAGSPFARTALVRLWRRHQAAAIIWST